MITEGTIDGAPCLFQSLRGEGPAQSVLFYRLAADYTLLRTMSEIVAVREVEPLGAKITGVDRIEWQPIPASARITVCPAPRPDPRGQG